MSNTNSLIDPFGRNVDYLRLSVTDRCNFRCNYCMAEDMTFLRRQKLLSLEELYDVASAFVDLGIKKIRLTGGEPLVRRDILKLIKALGKLPDLAELTMTTNGSYLRDMSQSLKAAGISRLNISIDSLKPERFKALTRVGKLEQVLAGIDSALDANFENIKLNSVIQAGVNDDEVIDLAKFAMARGLDISFIEEMPLGEITSHEREKTKIMSKEIRRQLETVWDLVDSAETTGGPARYVRVVNTASKIGFISPISNNFCGSCNRVRMTADGRLLLCLGNEDSLDVRAIVRSFPGDTKRLQEEIIGAIKRKPERHYFNPKQVDIVRFMNMTGG